MISTPVDRRRLRARRVLLSLSTVLCSGLTMPALAQTAPLYRNLDANGVDLTLGDYVMAFKEGSIGTGDGELALVRQNNGNNPSQWDGYIFNLSVSGGSTTVTVGQAGRYADKFTLVSGIYTPAKENGTTLTLNGDSYIYQSADGTKITFTNPWGNDGVPTNLCFTGSNNCSLLATSITSPNGTTVNIAYRFFSEANNFLTWRILSVSNNYGYSINFTYQNNAFSGSVPPAGWFNRASVKFFNNAISTTTPQSTLSYSYPAADTTDITDPMSNVWEITSTSIRRPGESSPSFSIGGTTSAVTSATRDGVTNNYSLIVSGSTGTMTVTDAQSHITTIVSDLTVGRPTAITDPLGRTTGYTYDSYGRLTKATASEGNYIQYALDGRGNATTTTQVAKSGSGLSNIVTSATYPSTCTNALTCNEPMSTTDALGNTTDYTYDSGTGLVTSITAPAASTGVNRPQTRYGYTAFQAYYYSGGSIVASGVPITKLTSISTCQTGSTCSGTSDEVVTSISYGPQTAGTGNNLLPVSTSKGAGNGSLTVTTALTYTGNGDIATVDGPLSGTADTTSYRYDAARRQVGVISADPDGAGPLKRRAVRTTYDSAGRVTVSEGGTVASTSDADWAAFSSAQALTTTWTSGRRTEDVLSSGATTYQVMQYSYDAVGRLECTALRMNSAAWGSLPTSACTLGTSGSYGADRVTRTVYDAAGQVTKSQSAYGTADQSDDASNTYNNNGTLATLTDAQANTTTYEYDGFDRLSKTRFPNTTTGAGTSSTTDYEQFVYDAGSEVTSHRLRGYASDSTQHIDYSYDHLGRVTFKDLPGSEPDVSYSYDLLNRTTYASTSGNDVSMGYDALSRMTTQTTPLGTMAATYDLAGRRLSTVWPDSFYVTYDRFVTGEVSAVRENGATSGVGVLATYSYDDLGRRTGITRGNGTTTSYSYDNVSRLSSLAHDLASTGNDLTLGFGYNPASQISSATRSNDVYAWTAAADRNDALSINGLNQTTAVGAGSLSYDARGNLTSTGSNSYTYSSENLLLSGPSTTLSYDPLKRLYGVVGNVTEYYLYDGQQRTAEYNNSDTIQRRYVFGPGDDEPLVWYEGSGTTDRRWLHADERGSVIAVSNGSGASIGTESYDEYGVPASTNIGKFQYTGQTYLPDLGLYYYKARLYSSRVGRFMQTDPVGYDDGVNWYNYASGDPIGNTDTTGMAADAASDPPDSPDIVVTGKRLPKLQNWVRDPLTTTMVSISISPVVGDDAGDIVVMAKRKPKPAPAVGSTSPLNTAPAKPFPRHYADTTSRQEICLFIQSIFGESDMSADTACGTDISGNNPKDPANASRERQVEIEKEQMKELAEATKQMLDRVGDIKP